MLEIFQKKKFLVDYLRDFVDIHNHILPGIDDGAKTIEDSLAMIKEMGELGISRFIATPHIMHNFYPNTPETINGALSELRNALLEHDLKEVTLNAAAEHMIDDNFENLLEENTAMPLGKDYLLVEMSFLQASINLNSAIEKTTKNGYFPILAHPERYLYYRNNQRILSSLKKQGTLLQLNILSLGEYYGIPTQKNAFQLIDKGLIDFVASDIHHLDHIAAIKKLQVNERMLNKLYPVLENTIEQFY